MTDLIRGRMTLERFRGLVAVEDFLTPMSRKVLKGGRPRSDLMNG